MFYNGVDIEPHAMDNDIEHLKSHMAFMDQHGDQSGHARVHVVKHFKQLQAKSAQANPGGGPSASGQGMPGGAGPGVAGTPRVGAQPGQPRPQGPPGMIHSDNMVSPEAGGRN